MNIEEIRAEVEAATPNPIRYFTDGQPYLTFGDVQISNHPAVEKLAEYDRFEKYIYPALLDALEAKERELAAAVEDLKLTHYCGVCTDAGCVNDGWLQCPAWQWRGLEGQK